MAKKRNEVGEDRNLMGKERKKKIDGWGKDLHGKGMEIKECNG